MKRDIFIMIAVSVLLSVTGFVLDLNERVQDIWTNIFEILMMAGCILVAILIIYIPIKLILSALRRQPL